MIRIGRFAEECGISVKTIRYYEQKGLIKPAYIDNYTNYRYYNEENVQRIMEILFYKELGFTLKEIKHLNLETIMNKITSLKNKIIKIQKNIKELEKMMINKKGESMRVFENDEMVIGKWELIGRCNEDNLHKLAKSDFGFHELYFLPDGKEYWVLGWTKGLLKIKDQQHLYKIVDGLLYLYVQDLNGVVGGIEVYKKVNDKHYHIDDIRIKDNINLPFVYDEAVVGTWNYADFVSEISNFDPNNLQLSLQWLESLTFTEDGKIVSKIVNKEPKDIFKWTKNIIIDPVDLTASKYEIKNIDNNTYLFFEWKSGDYIFGKRKPFYYVLKKDKRLL